MKPLLEQGTQILNETEGGIKALDPDGKIARNAKNRTQGQQATPQEYYLAEKLSQVCLSPPAVSHFPNPCFWLFSSSIMILDSKVAFLGGQRRVLSGVFCYSFSRWRLTFPVIVDTKRPKNNRQRPG